MYTNSCDFLYFPINPLTGPSRIRWTGENIAVKREIVDLKMRDQSYNQIVNHFAEHRGLIITKHDISKVIIEAGERAKHLNAIYDSMVRRRFKVIEIDEEFQGRSTCYLGIVDKESQYVYRFARMEDRNRESFVRELEGLADVMDMLEVIITDGHPVYKTIIPELFDGIVHLLCHVHSYRIFLKDADIYHRAAADALKSLKKAEDTLVKAKHELALKRRQLRRLRDKVRRIETEYDLYRSVHGVKKYSKKARWTTERCNIVKRLNIARSCLRSKIGTVKNKDGRVNDLIVESETKHQAYMEKKQISLQTGRLLSMFRHLLSCQQKEFDAVRGHLIAALKRSSCPIAGKMLKFINDNPQLQPATGIDLDASCDGFNMCTNMVESFFGIARPLLDKARRFAESDQSEALLEIFRLQVNLSSPFTGPNKQTTPLERAGVHSGYQNYLDALFAVKTRDSRDFKNEKMKRSRDNDVDSRRMNRFGGNYTSNPATGEIQLKYMDQKLVYHEKKEG